jgi:hypothetical protein
MPYSLKNTENHEKSYRRIANTIKLFSSSGIPNNSNVKFRLFLPKNKNSLQFSTLLSFIFATVICYRQQSQQPPTFNFSANINQKN